ncbi:MAG: helix-turn-helix transcriptional regulator [Planctomycetota bacterium]
MIDLQQIAQQLGERIRALRKKMGLKQAQFAQMVGMSRDAIGLMERGDKLPRLESICKIADKLNIPLSKLLDFDKTIAQEKTRSRGQDPLSSLNLYLKTKSSKQVQMIRDVAHDIFDKNRTSDSV